jgi:type IV secretion system protein VirB1
MDNTTFLTLVAACAPLVHPLTAHALVEVESAFNPYAIGVVGGALDRQPRNRAEAISTARALDARGWNFSVGLAQINVHNFGRLGLDVMSVFDPCTNLHAMQVVLYACFRQAGGSTQASLRRALSCYYSGNQQTGFRHGYVGHVIHAARIRDVEDLPTD